MTELREQLIDLKAKAKHWIAQSRMTSSAEVKILLTKVDAAYNQIAQLERSLGDAHKQIKGLHSGKRDLMAQMGLMVPVSELHAAKAESSKLRETIDGLSQLLRSTQAEAEKQSAAMQVPMQDARVASRIRIPAQRSSRPAVSFGSDARRGCPGLRRAWSRGWSSWRRSRRRARARTRCRRSWAS